MSLLTKKTLGTFMSFKKSLDYIMGLARESYDFYNAEMLNVCWETKPNVVKELLPRPLKPIKEEPYVVAFIANYPKTNFGSPYKECALSVKCQFEDTKGLYVLSMPVNNDMAMAAGREFYGYPKKIANISLERKGDVIKGSVERKDVKFVEMNAKVIERPSDAEIKKYKSLIGFENDVVKIYNFKHFPAADGTGFDYNPHLIQQAVQFKQNSIETVDVKVSLKLSEFDPWAECEIVNILKAVYTIGNNSMLKAKVVAEAKITTFAPYAFLKWDGY